MARQGAGARKPSTPAAPTSSGWLATEPPSPIRARISAAEHGLQQERGEGSAGIEEAEETHQRLALSQPGDDFRLEQVVDQRGERRGKRDHEGEVSKKWHAPDLGPSAPALLLHRRWCTPRRHSATDEHGTRHATRRPTARAV